MEPASSRQTRRKFVGNVGTGLAAAAIYNAAATPASAQDAGTMSSQAAKRNPVTQYPPPPFPAQSQPWPGLARDMSPRPDHGETSYRGSGRLAGRKALITGGDSGMGRAAAIAFAREGADVAINYLPAEEPDAQDVVKLIRASDRTALTIPGDIREESFCRAMVDRAVSGLGGLDILVNNAGRQQSHASILDISSEQFDWTIKTNIYAMFWITKAAVPHLSPGSAIINTASEQAYNPSENLLDYASTKAAIVAFTKSLAKQLAKDGVRVNAVAPGPVWTALQVTGGQDPSKIPTFGADTPMGRAGQPAELGPVYVALASQEFSFSTGQVYGASGGHGNP